MLARHGVDASKVDVVSAGSDAARASALVAVTIDGGLVNALLAVAMLAKLSNLHVLEDTSTDFGDDYIRNVLVARDDAIQADPQLFQTVTKALIEGTRILQSNRAIFVSFVRSQPALPGSAVGQTSDLFSKRPTP